MAQHRTFRYATKRGVLECPRTPPPNLGQTLLETAVQTILKRLGTCLKKKRPEFFESLCAPLGTKQLADVETKLGFALPEELRALLTWHDGQADDFETLAGPYCLMTAEEIVTNVKLLPQDAKGAANPAAWWSETWVPFMRDGEGNLVCVDRTTGKVVFYEHDNANRAIVAPNVEALLKAVTAGYAKDALSPDGSGPDDEDAWREICETHQVELAGLE
jgi:cell wall assembly regulator SMI1